MTQRIGVSLSDRMVAEAEIKRLWAAEDHDLRCKKSLRAEIERLRAARDVWDKRDIAQVAEIERLKLLVYSNLGDNHHNANDCPYCKAALKDTTPQPEFTAYGPTDDTA